ncbi:MAG: DinB family protein [Chloroflexi bacterium]|nr:DinB family protein [Chloroflexota bacterium]
MDAVTLLRGAFESAHQILEGTMADVTDELAHWSPPGHANSVASNYIHIVTGAAGMLSKLRGAAPLIAGEWGAKAGVSAPPPLGFGDWSAWAETVRIDLPAFRAYAQAVYASTDAWLATLTDADLARDYDLTAAGMGMKNWGWYVSCIVLGHANNHCGEISALKGVHGDKGYPF